MTLKKRKLNFRFHNPNDDEVTARYISELLAEVAVSKVKKAQTERLQQQKKAV